MQNGSERDYTGARTTCDGRGRASCTLPIGCGDTAGIVKRKAGCRPQADTTYHGQTRALGSASSGPGTIDRNGRAATDRRTGGSQCDGA
ncbi:MAG TPA: hypothetical protein VJ353_02145, partial [Xanthobacteraceae bacterium]|nr:hypothetical protein [Xanthobacteraceae bacterium]